MTAVFDRRTESVDDEQLLSDEVPESRYATVRIAVAIACLLGAQFLHWSVIDQHAQEWRASGVFFFLLAILEGVLSVLVFTRIRPWIAAVGIAISVVPVMVWAWDRALGLPFGPTKGVRGTIGRSDVMCVVFEVVTVIALLPFLRRRDAKTRRGRVDLVGRAVIGITCVYVVGFSVWALLGDQGAIHKLSGTTVVTIAPLPANPADSPPLNSSP
jgi:hypothetical protein